jgi:hypothetical protein
LLDQDASVRRFFEGESESLPVFYTDQVRKDLGPWWDALPEGSLRHDPNAYLKAHQAAQTPAHLEVARPLVAAQPTAPLPSVS